MRHNNLFVWAFIPFVMMMIWSFTDFDTSGVRGLILPADGVRSVWLISGKDTLKHSPLNGQFAIESKPGVYQLLVDAMPGYKDMMLERVIVEESRMTDLGELVLQKIVP